MTKYRIGGGLQVVQNGYLIGPVRGSDAPRKPASLDISAGLMEPDEGMRSTQVREGAEEIIRLKDGKIFLPDFVKEAGVVEEVTHTIAEAIEDTNSPFEHGFELGFYESQVRVPAGLKEVWIQGHSLHDWETGVVPEEENTPSYELINYLVEEPPADSGPVDTEVIPGDTNTWLNRFVYKFHPMTGHSKLYRSGEVVFEGSFNQMIKFLEEEFEEEMDYTVKVKAALEGLPAEEDRIYDEIDFSKNVEKFFNVGNSGKPGPIPSGSKFR